MAGTKRISISQETYSELQAYAAGKGLAVERYLEMLLETTDLSDIEFVY